MQLILLVTQCKGPGEAALLRALAMDARTQWVKDIVVKGATRLVSAIATEATASRSRSVLLWPEAARRALAASPSIPDAVSSAPWFPEMPDLTRPS